MYGNVILPFVDRFPKDLELYDIMTTRLEERHEADVKAAELKDGMNEEIRNEEIKEKAMKQKTCLGR